MHSITPPRVYIDGKEVTAEDTCKADPKLNGLCPPSERSEPSVPVWEFYCCGEIIGVLPGRKPDATSSRE